jgi:Glycoside hydrolase family 44
MMKPAWFLAAGVGISLSLLLTSCSAVYRNTNANYVLTIDSTNPLSGVSISVSQPDVNGASGGATSFTRTYSANTSITLTAPSTAGGNAFSSWTGCTAGNGITCSVTLTGNTTVTAEYAVSTSPLPALITPTVTVTPSPTSITTAQSLSVAVSVSGGSGNPTPTGSIALTSGSYISVAATLSNGSATVAIPAGALAAGTDTLTATYTPDAGSNSAYTTAAGKNTVTVMVTAATPTVTVTPASTQITNAQSLSVTVAVSGGSGYPTATGTIILSSGTYASSTTALSNGSTTISIPAGSLAVGVDTLTAVYTPDSGSSSTYGIASGTGSITVTSSSPTGITVSIDVLANRHPISPFIYGGAYPQDAAHVTDSGTTLVRWGGDATSTYNWQLGTDNAANDYYYEDYAAQGFNNGDDASSTQFIADVENAGSHPLMTMVMLPWVAQSPETSVTQGGTDNYHWSFSVAQFGAQCSTDYWNSDAGDGLDTDCSTPVTTNAVTTAYYPLLDDSSQTCTASTCIYRNAWAEALATAFGSGTCAIPDSTVSSCHFYDMDNEIEIWGSTHRDVHPAAAGYDELASVYLTEAAKLKTWDPAAVRFGPVTCCWWFYWNGADNNDKAAHGGVDFVPWWLNQVYWQDEINGTRTLDVFDLHAYPDANTSGLSQTQLQALAVNIYRDYWDPTFVSPSSSIDQVWTTNIQPDKTIPFRIPRMRAIVNMIYPGTPMSFTEWSAPFAGESDFSTALGDADAYGIFGRERLSFASRWQAPVPTNPNYQALKLFTNYDGSHHGFGTTSISATNTGNPALLSSYAALDSSGKTLTVMVLNKDPNNTAQIHFDLSGFTATSFVSYTLASTASSNITASASQAWTAAQSFAPYTATLLVITGDLVNTPVSDWDLNPDAIMVPAGGTVTLHPRITSGSANVTLSSAVFDSYEGVAACSGTLGLTTAVLTPSHPGALTVNGGSTPGFCHFTVTASDATVTQTEGGWIVVGNPPATLTQTGSGQSGTHGQALAQPLMVTLNPGQSGGDAAGASILFTTSAGSLSNGTNSGTGVIAVTDSSGVASVTLTLPTTTQQVNVQAQAPIALGAATTNFTETAQ